MTDDAIDVDSATFNEKKLVLIRIAYCENVYSKSDCYSIIKENI